MRNEAKLTFLVVMNGIIVHEKRQSHDYEVSFCRLQEKNARRVFKSIILNNIVILANRYPLLAEKEVNIGELILALRNNIALGHLVLVSIRLIEELVQKVFEVCFW